MTIDQWRNKQLRIERKLKQVNLSYVAMWVAGALTMLTILFSIVFIKMDVNLLTTVQIPIYAHPIVLGVFAVSIWIIVIMNDKNMLEVE